MTTLYVKRGRLARMSDEDATTATDIIAAAEERRERVRLLCHRLGTLRDDLHRPPWCDMWEPGLAEEALAAAIAELRQLVGLDA